MKFIDEFRDQALVQDLARRLAALAALTKDPATVMEVCGTHTMAAARFGLKSLLPPGSSSFPVPAARCASPPSQTWTPSWPWGPNPAWSWSPSATCSGSPARTPPWRASGPRGPRCGWFTPPWTRWNWPGRPRLNTWCSSGWGLKPPCPPPPWPSRPRRPTAWIISRSGASTRPCPPPSRRS